MIVNVELAVLANAPPTVMTDLFDRLLVTVPILTVESVELVWIFKEVIPRAPVPMSTPCAAVLVSPIFKVDALPAKLTVVGVTLIKLNVVAVLVISPPFTAASPASVRLGVAPPLNVVIPPLTVNVSPSSDLLVLTPTLVSCVETQSRALAVGADDEPPTRNAS